MSTTSTALRTFAASALALGAILGLSGCNASPSFDAGNGVDLDLNLPENFSLVKTNNGMDEQSVILRDGTTMAMVTSTLNDPKANREAAPAFITVETFTCETNEVTGWTVRKPESKVFTAYDTSIKNNPKASQTDTSVESQSAMFVAGQGNDCRVTLFKSVEVSKTNAAMKGDAKALVVDIASGKMGDINTP